MNDPTVQVLNPNHPTTQAMEGQWVKIVALMMLRDGVSKTVIPTGVIEAMLSDTEGTNVAVKFDDNDGITLMLVTDVEAQRIARKEGGLPT